MQIVLEEVLLSTREELVQALFQINAGVEALIHMLSQLSELKPNNPETQIFEGTWEALQDYHQVLVMIETRVNPRKAWPADRLR